MLFYQATRSVFGITGEYMMKIIKMTAQKHGFYFWWPGLQIWKLTFAQFLLRLNSNLKENNQKVSFISSQIFNAIKNNWYNK